MDKVFFNRSTQTSENAIHTLIKIIELKSVIEKDRIINMGKRSTNALDLFHYLFKKPVITVKDVENFLKLTPKSVNVLIDQFVNKNILLEITGFKRNRVFHFYEYMKLYSS